MELEEYLASGLVKLKLEGDTKEEVLQELVELLYEERKINSKEKFYQAIQEREKEESTGLGYGVALPHGKSEAVEELAVAVGRKECGIDFDSLDSKPAKLFFMIADSAGYSREYLQIVSNLAGQLRKKDLRKDLMAADTEEEIVDILTKIAKK